MTRASGHLLLALQHSDSQFPSGGFAFSQGLEAASQLSARLGEFNFAGFLEGQIRHRWAAADRIALARSHRCCGVLNAIAELDAEVEVSTLADGLRAGSRRNGMALLTTHARLGTIGADAYRVMIRQSAAFGHLPVMQGMLWHSLGLDEKTAVAISGYQAAASLATAAIRLGLIGAIEAQRHVTDMLPLIETAGAVPVGEEEPISSFVPLAEIAVALHGTAGQRLFSN